MQSTQAPKNQLVSFPAKEEIALTPAVWLACGVVAYNFALLARHPMRILAPNEIDNLAPSRADHMNRGLAVAVDASTLTPSIRSAMLQISRTLLTPLHFTISLQGQAGKRHYLLLEYHGGLQLPMPEDIEKHLPPSPAIPEPATAATSAPTA